MVGDILQVAPAAPTARPFSSLMIYRHLHLIMIYPQLQELMTLKVSSSSVDRSSLYL